MVIAIPVLGDLLLCIFCVGVMAGSAGSMKLWLDTHRAENLASVDALVLGACSGAVSAAADWGLSLPIRLSFGEGLSNLYDSFTFLPDLARNNMKAMHRSDLLEIVMSLPIQLALYAVMGAVGGFIALQFAFPSRKTQE